MNANLLVDPCIRVQDFEGREETLSLPEILARLEQDAIMSFPGLRAHQTHPWFAFCCQLAALALEGKALPDVRRGDPTTFLGVGDETTWRERLRSLTVDWPDDGPWTLVVDDWSRPAFMQAPYSGKEARQKWECHAKLSPDDLDVLIQSKAHTIKPCGIDAAPPDTWIFALVSVQTQAQYTKHNMNSSRQNSGNGARACVHLAPVQSIGMQFCRDVRLMLDNQDDCYSSGIDYDTAGPKLIWLQTWDGQTSLALPSLHPWYIEISRLYRLVDDDQILKALFLPSMTCRIEANANKGNVGDPWIPIEAKGAKAFNVKPRYEVLESLLLHPEEFRPALTQQHHDRLDPSANLALEVSILLRGNSVTNGYEHRRVPLPPKPTFLKKPDEAAKGAAEMISLAKSSQNQVLKPALYKLFGEDPKKQERGFVQRYINDLDTLIDERFFPALWEMLDHKSKEELEWNEAVAPWRTLLREEAWQRLMLAEKSLPLSCAQRMKRQTEAESYFDHLWNTHCEPREEFHGPTPRRRIDRR